MRAPAPVRCTTHTRRRATTHAAHTRPRTHAHSPVQKTAQHFSALPTHRYLLGQPLHALQNEEAASAAQEQQQKVGLPFPQGLPTTNKLSVSWAGAGIYFFWQLGAMKYMSERYDLTKIPMAGASGGALAAVLGACGVQADDAFDLAYKISLEQNIWERKGGLIGIWGSMIERWLDELLPPNAHELCRGRVTVVVTTLPDWSQVGISDFMDKQDLINTVMASSHVPFFLDYKLTRQCRGRACVDGSFPDFFTGMNSEPLRTGHTVIFDYFDDKQLNRRGRMDMLEVKSIDEIRRIYSVGYDFAARLHSAGYFNQLDLKEVLLEGPGQNMQELFVPKQQAQASATSKEQIRELEDAVISGAGLAGPHLNVDLEQKREQREPQLSPSAPAPLFSEGEGAQQQQQLQERQDGGLVLDLQHGSSVKHEEQPQQ